MMRHFKTLVALSAVAAIGLLVGGPARSDIVVNPVPVISGGGPFTWTYTATLTAGQTLKYGDFFTIYDFYGWVPGSQFAPNALWNLTTNATGVTEGPTPNNPPVTVNEDVKVVNLSWQWVGFDLVGTGQSLGSFGADSTTNITQAGVYAEESHVGNAGTSSTGAVLTPTPEPATLLLYGVGMIGAVGFWRHRRTMKLA